MLDYTTLHACTLAAECVGYVALESSSCRVNLGPQLTHACTFFQYFLSRPFSEQQRRAATLLKYRIHRLGLGQIGP